MRNGAEINEAKIIAYLNRELSNEEMIKVDRWLTASPENMEKYNDIRTIWRRSGELKARSVLVDTDKAWNSVLGKINNSEDQVIPIRSKSSSSKMVALIAASIAVLIGAAVALVFVQPVANNEVQLSAQNEVLNEQLPDGTEITLNKNSTLSYPSDFEGDERRVSLSGEAFFEVERNEEKPFIIDLAENKYVKVLGTTFNVKSIEGEETTGVYVNTGKVEIGSENSTLILVAGEKGVIDNRSGEVSKVNENDIGFEELFWIDQSLKFDGEPLVEVIEILNKVYNAEVSIDCDEVLSEPIRSQHEGESLDEVLSVIAEVHDLKVEKTGGKFVLKCND
jgi:ferric-dicitrate binding protein FerR (iron transport regulator)